MEKVMPPPALNRQFSICGYFFLCLNIVLLAYLRACHESLFWKLTREDSVIENLTAAWCFGGGILFFITAYLVERGSSRRLVYTLGGIALLFVAGEEISWGQRIFDYPTPDILARINQRHEFNLHNITWTSYNFLPRAEIILRYGAFLLPMTAVAAFFWGKKRVFGIRLPSIWLAFGLLTVPSYALSLPPLPYMQLIGLGAVGAILFIFALFLKQRELLSLIATNMIVTLCLVTMTWMHTPFIFDIGIRYLNSQPGEIIEYSIAFASFWYALEMFLVQRSTTAESREAYCSMGRHLLHRLGSMFRISPPIRLMTGRLRLPATTPYFFVTSFCLGLLSLSYSSLMHRNAAIYEMREAIGGGAPIISSHFDVWNPPKKLIYSKYPCRSEDYHSPFFLYIAPVVHNRILPSLTFFSFHTKNSMVYRRAGKPGAQSIEECLMSVPLPKYEIAQIRTGQWKQWEGSLPSDTNDSKVMQAAIAYERLLVRSDFDIFLNDNILIYTKGPCTLSDIESPFFLHVYPTNKMFLPFWRSWQHDFGNLDFVFTDRGKLSDDKCLAAVPLPRYDISRIESGQYTREGHRRLWGVDVPFHER